MNRIILLSFVFLVFISCQSNKKNTAEQDGYIYSVHGKMDIANLGISLTHEHIMSRFGLESSYVPVYLKDSLFMQVIPYLKEVKALGIVSIFDCTTAYFGRDVRLLKEISDSTGMEIITNTGYYAAADDRYVPESAYESTIEEISRIWIEEFENGIDGTDIKPGFIKLGFDNGASDIDSKLFSAGILTHLSTGMTMAVHTGDNPAAVENQLELLEQFKVSPSAIVWVHASNTADDNLLIETAGKGVWISLDKFKSPATEDYVSRITLFKEKDLLHKVLLSHDGNSFNGKDQLRGYKAVITHLVPALKENGFSDDEINQLLVLNPKNAFRVEVRNL
jgi:predicted metal-dependent phosphotriesterase family hydrolase